MAIGHPTSAKTKNVSAEDGCEHRDSGQGRLASTFGEPHVSLDESVGARKRALLPLVGNRDEPFLGGDLFEPSPAFGRLERIDSLPPLVVLDERGFLHLHAEVVNRYTRVQVRRRASTDGERLLTSSESLLEAFTVFGNGNKGVAGQAALHERLQSDVAVPARRQLERRLLMSVGDEHRDGSVRFRSSGSVLVCCCGALRVEVW